MQYIMLRYVITPTEFTITFDDSRCKIDYYRPLLSFPVDMTFGLYVKFSPPVGQVGLCLHYFKVAKTFVFRVNIEGVVYTDGRTDRCATFYSIAVHDAT